MQIKQAQTTQPVITPEIQIWYGLEQVFGNRGRPQRQYNLLGSITPFGPEAVLTYSLNDGPPRIVPLAENRRLARPGDFNVEVFDDDPLLVAGRNNIRFQLITPDADARTQMDLWYLPEATTPLLGSISWIPKHPIPHRVQVVDGLWDITPNGIHTRIPGYDRSLALGDCTWQDYEVRVPVTILSALTTDASSLGIAFHWQGHFPINGENPSNGWWHFGAYASYRIRADGNHLGIRLNRKPPPYTCPFELEFGRAYIFCLRVETLPETEICQYYLKVWPADGAEPETWNLVGTDTPEDYKRGSVLLVANQVDAIFGDVIVTPTAPR